MATKQPDETGSNKAIPEIRELVRKFVPWDGCLAVRPIYEGRTASGLIIPETARENAQVFICQVFAVGPGCKRVRVDDVVLVYGGTRVRKVKWNTLSEEQDFILLEEATILGTLGDSPEGYEPETLTGALRQAIFGPPSQQEPAQQQVVQVVPQQGPRVHQ